MAAGCEALAGIDLNEVVSEVLSEFLEVAFHYILYVRELYPHVFFERRRKYNISVWMCVHPELNQYIRDVLVGARALIKKGDMDKIVLAISNKDHQLVERFIFQMKDLSEDALRDDNHLLQLESELRAMLMKISVCDSMLKPNPPDCTFRVFIHTNRVAAAGLEHQQEFGWLSADREETKVVPNTISVPLKSISSSLIKMELVAEECATKNTV